MAKKRAKKRRKREQLDLGELDQLPAPITLTDPDGEGALAITAAEEAVAEVANLDEPESDPRYEELEMRRQTIAELAMDKPAQVAEQLRSWMAAN